MSINILNLKKRFVFFQNRINTSKKKYLVRKKTLKLSNVLKIHHNKFFLVQKPISFSILRKSSKSLQIYQSQKHFLFSLNLFNYFNIYKKFICLVFRAGKKLFWENTFSSVFYTLSKKLNYSRNFILLKIFLRLHTRVEIRKVKARRRVYLIPLFIKVKRRFFLALKWLLLSLKKKIQIPLKDKLFSEILILLKKKSCFALKQLEDNNLGVYANRANMHFRW